MRFQCLKFAVPALLFVVCLPAQLFAAESHGAMGEQIPLVATIPFVALLLSIAIFPLAAEHWWEDNRHKAIIVGLLSLPIVVYLLASWGSTGAHELTEKAMEYTSFIILLASLFTISGGVHLQGSLSGTPLLNTAVLALGAPLANLVGTTGASMLLIRPLLRANEPRKRKAHVIVFFIFVVSNCGGLLTPLGDPPLFLGFLKGVPFEWTLGLWPQWLVVNGLLLVIFNVWDQMVFDKEELERPGSQLEEVMHHPPLRIKGLYNFAFLLGIVAVIFFSGRFKWTFGIAEGLMLTLALASYFITPRKIHEANRFSFAPIAEVAVLFAGIFITMIPALLILNARGPELGVKEPWQFFWAAGILSSFLDNAPTYLTFAATASGIEGIQLEGNYLAEFLSKGPAAAQILAAISCGAVFMGANTYIGNGPNFMVKAIAEQNGVKMPSFFGYMAYSTCVLIPIFVVVTFLFFR